MRLSRSSSLAAVLLQAQRIPAACLRTQALQRCCWLHTGCSLLLSTVGVASSCICRRGVA
jgi:hypothetical protein